MPYSFDNELGDGIRHIGDILDEMLTAQRTPARSDKLEKRDPDNRPRFASDAVWVQAANKGFARR